MAVVYSTFTQDFSYTVEIKNLESIRLTEKYLKVLLILNNCDLHHVSEICVTELL